MARFHKLKIKEVRPETEECVSVALELPEELTEGFQFIPGQYLTFRTNIAGEEVRRSYSICTSPEEKDLRVAIKKVPQGRFSTYANEQLQAGDELEVMSPMGNFLANPDPLAEKHYLAFAAGSGITPIMAILKSVLAQEPKSNFTLFYGNRQSESIIFREELEGLKNQYLGRLSIHHLLSREQMGSDLFYGRIDAEKCRTFFEKLIDLKEVDEVFLCGPEGMIHTVSEELRKRGVSNEQIHFELFTTANGVSPVRKKFSESNSKEATEVRIQLDGEILEFSVENREIPLLDAALRAGADLPYSCKGGVCSTCRAKLEEGEVKMLVNYALEPDELEAGYILSCQALPITDKIAINFDA